MFATDLLISRSNTLPFFATGIRPIEYIVSYGQRDNRETDMMDSRWKVFELTHQIPKEEMQHVDVCEKCFYNLVMLDSGS